jgi:hypothetical protein
VGCNCGGVRSGYKRIYRHVQAGKAVKTTTSQQLAEQWRKEPGRVERRVVSETVPTTHG